MYRHLILVAISSGALAPGHAFAHHSRAAYDLTREIVVDGIVADLAWKNPHIFMTVATRSPDGEPRSVEIEVTSVSEAGALGLPRETIAPGARVVVRAHPGRGDSSTRAVGLDVRTSDGRIYPLNTDSRLAIRAPAVEARGIAGGWAPTLESFNGLMAAAASWPLTEGGRARAAEARSSLSSSTATPLGICEPFPPPTLSIFPDLRTIDVNDATITMRFEGAVGVIMERIVHLDRDEHPADVAPSLMGHSIGRWEGEILVIDTVAFSPHPVGVWFFSSGPNKHLVERLALTSDRVHLDYTFTLEDPDVLAEPVTYTATWDHRPDLGLSGEACDPEVARRGLASPDDSLPGGIR